MECSILFAHPFTLCHSITNLQGRIVRFTLFGENSPTTVHLRHCRQPYNINAVLSSSFCAFMSVSTVMGPRHIQYKFRKAHCVRRILRFVACATRKLLTSALCALRIVENTVTGEVDFSGDSFPYVPRLSVVFYAVVRE